jgi:hypothetical protein
LKFQKGGCVTFTGAGALTGLSEVTPQNFCAYSDGTHPLETTQAFQAALAAAYKVTIPAGTYSVTGLVQPNKQNHVYGLGSARSGGVTIKTTSAVGWSFPTTSQTSRFTKLENLRIVAAAGTTGILVANSGVNMVNTYVVGGAVGLQLAASVMARIESCGFYGTVAGILGKETSRGDVVWQNTFANVITSSYGAVPNAAIGLHVTSAIAEFFKGNHFQSFDAENVSIGIKFDNSANIVAKSNTFTDFYTENVADKYVDEGNDLNYNTWINPRLVTVGGGLANPANASIYSTHSTRIFDATVRSDVGYFNQIVFPVKQVPSALPNVLDDYREGTWTPVVNRAQGGWAGTYSTQTGTYTKIGRLVTVYGKITISGISSASSGVNIIQGLPFNAATKIVGGVGVVSTDSALSTRAKSVRMTGSTGLYIQGTVTSADIDEKWLPGTIEFSCTYESAN